MEQAPLEKDKGYAPQSAAFRDPNALAWQAVSEDRRRRTRQERRERIRHDREALAAILLLAHGVVELSLRSKRPKVRQTIRSDLDRRYGLRGPNLFLA